MAAIVGLLTFFGIKTRKFVIIVRVLKIFVYVNCVYILFVMIIGFKEVGHYKEVGYFKEFNNKVRSFAFDQCLFS